MSTAILQSTPVYDFGDIHMKVRKTDEQAFHGIQNMSFSLQAASRSLSHTGITNSTMQSFTNNNMNTTTSNNNNLLNNNHLYHGTTQTSVPANQNQSSNNNNLMTQRINAAAAAIVAQQQNHQKFMLHNALSRAASHPQGSVASFVNSIIENLGQGHRKLERTQSEPLPQANTSRYKTELCRPFEEAGACKYGEKCQFAHGVNELRNLQRHPKYKTELCRTFHSVGFCPYGPRCHFVHNAEEARNHNRAVHAAVVRAAIEAGQPIPLSPSISMSTGSDRASPTGSLSLSPTCSMASFFADQTSPTFPQGFTFPSQHSPPASPINLSPIASPPPGDDARLPIFNQLSSTLDAFKQFAL
ncbi:Protein TIS11 [Pseudolycoriella hygida]|uniref:Protein TIS11 n=1 Tax=Pseudolycoriella hygida TaxID=35572 RepID=A0A9Q0MQA0_9DIPT|nr:Protein TIS11 [Pseudolycoriella hygida]